MVYCGPYIPEDLTQVWTQWLTFCRQHFQIQFLEWKWLYFDSDWTDVYSLTPVDKSILVQVMAWHQTGNREEINFLLIVILLMWIQMLIIQAVYYDQSAPHFRDEYWLQILANGLCCFKTPLMQNAWGGGGGSWNSTNHSPLLLCYSYLFFLQNILHDWNIPKYSFHKFVCFLIIGQHPVWLDFNKGNICPYSLATVDCLNNTRGKITKLEYRRKILWCSRWKSDDHCYLMTDWLIIVISSLIGWSLLYHHQLADHC